jgi:hypothetical protein
MAEFSRSNPHDNRVQVLLDADEYLFARDEAKRRGIDSMSAYFRLLLANDRREVALEQLSVTTGQANTAEPTQDIHTIVTMAVSAAMSAYEQAKK